MSGHESICFAGWAIYERTCPASRAAAFCPNTLVFGGDGLTLEHLGRTSEAGTSDASSSSTDRVVYVANRRIAPT